MNSRTLAVIEDMLKPSAEQARGMSTLELARLRGVIEVDLYRLGVPIVRIHAATLKAYASAGDASKASMLEAARDCVGTAALLANDNEADAFWLLAMAMHRHGWPLVPVTPRRVNFVGHALWGPWVPPADGQFTIVAIDPSLSSTGLVVWRTGRPMQIATIRSQPMHERMFQGWAEPARHDSIARRISERLDLSGYHQLDTPSTDVGALAEESNTA
jgi:hypothetical protein